MEKQEGNYPKNRIVENEISHLGAVAKEIEGSKASLYFTLSLVELILPHLKGWFM